MAELKTARTDVDPAVYLAAQPKRRREESAALLEDFAAATGGLTPRMWGPSMIGYGRYRYRYESGREGEWFITGFAPRARALTIYVMPGYRDLGEPLQRLGKHRLGKSCLYINKLADVDRAVLREIVAEGVRWMRANYETYDD